MDEETPEMISGRFLETLKKLKPLVLNRYTVFILFFLQFNKLLYMLGGLYSSASQLKLELPFVLYLYVYFNHIFKKNRWTPFLAAAPIILIYSVHDYFYVMLGRIIKLSDLREVPLLINISSALSVFLGFFVITALLISFFLATDRKRIPGIMTGLVPLIAIFFVIEFQPDLYIKAVRSTRNKLYTWSESKSVNNNGRFVMFFYHEALRKTTLTKFTAFRNRQIYAQENRILVESLKAHLKKSNVHIIVLESFVDPNLLTKAVFSINPNHHDFETIINGTGGFSVSPTFGGDTAIAEFEVLCGVPTFSYESGIEFNIFTGSRTFCLPEILGELGYRTIATNSYKPDYYNHLRAYKSTGFNEIYFPQEYTKRRTYFSAGNMDGENKIFDSVILRQNLAFIKDILKSGKTEPVLNFILTIYGHWPYAINTEKRPLVIDIKSGTSDYALIKYVNQYYYRTKAIADFVRELIMIDPDSIIILVSDHLPTMTKGTLLYSELNYLDNIENNTHFNQIFIIRNGVPVRYKNINHYNISEIILDFITGGAYCDMNHCFHKSDETHEDRDKYHESYMKLVAHGME